MPSRPCKHPTCTRYVPRGSNPYCAQHAEFRTAERAEHHRAYDRHRRNPEAKAFYNSSAWKRARAKALADNPVCRRCQRAWSQHVHHLKPLEECTLAERTDQANLYTCCAKCHGIIETEQRNDRRDTDHARDASSPAESSQDLRSASQ